eukprot:339663_1
MTGLVPLPIISDAAAVGAGAMCGALCRHHLGKAATERIAKDPSLKYLTGWHTAGINVLGSFILGGVYGSPLVDTTATVTTAAAKIKTATATSTAAASGISGLSPRMKLLLGVGFCGSFTTFSTFSVDVVNMMGRGEMARAASYVMTNNVGGFCAAAAGMMAAKKIFRL